MKIKHKYGLGINRVEDVEEITDKNFLNNGGMTMGLCDLNKGIIKNINNGS